MATPAPKEAADQIIKVLLCDDSSVARSVLERLLRTDASIRVVAKAVNGLEAVEAVQAGGIDVVVLDIEMPVMDGLAALPRLLAADRAVKVLMSSMMTTKGARSPSNCFGSAPPISFPSRHRQAAVRPTKSFVTN